MRSSTSPAKVQPESPAALDMERMNRFLRPKRVAVVGASRDEESVGGVLLGNLLRGGFSGEIYPVNPEASEIQGECAYPSLSECPEVPDLVIVAVPAKGVQQVVDEAGRAGVAAVCVISAGFGEAGAEGRGRAEALLETVQAHGLRMIGPNCMGLLNASEGVRLNGTFSRTFPAAGRVGMLSQSGALGLAVLDHADEFQLGLSTFVSIGNKLDVSATDLIQYWEQDSETDVLLLYLESIEHPDEFRHHARRITREKPIVVVKSGRTEAGERAASSHTAAVAGQDDAAGALFEQCGVIRVDTLREMFDTTKMLASGCRPRGRRVGIITNGGGPGILAADACAAHGLEVPTLGDSTQTALAELLPKAAALRNPVDLLAGADAEIYEQALRIVGGSGDVDLLLTIFIPPIVIEADEVARALARGQRELPADVPILGVFMGRERRPQALVDAAIPTFEFPEEAVSALGRVIRWSEWRRQPPESPFRPGGIDVDRAQETIRRAYARGTSDPKEARWMTTREAADLLGAYGIELSPFRVVSDPEAAAEAQRMIAAPVAVKVDAPIHKTDIGGVVLGCETPEQAAEAVDRIRGALEQSDQGHHAGRYLIQEMVGDGVELAVGVRADPSFGPVLMVGWGGTLLEVFEDVCVRLPPLTPREANEMLRSLKSYPLLTGYRGQPAGDLEALLDLIHRVGALAAEQGEVAELDLNPVFVKSQGVIAADVRLRLRTKDPGQDVPGSC